MYLPIAKPFIKWVGGKRRLLPHLLERLPKKFNGYIEPMVGGGALALHMGLPDTMIGDLNAELICVYESVRDKPDELIDALQALPIKDRALVMAQFKAFKNQRLGGRASKVSRAARLIYLTKVGFNGLYRVNSDGEYNVPFGMVPKVLCDYDNLRKASQALQDTTIYNGTYQDLCKRARPGDLVYLDPPYLPKSAGGFTSYQSGGFGTRDALRMRDEVARLHNRGVYVMMSQLDSASIRYLYGWMEISEVSIKHTVGAKTTTKANEIILTNYSRDLYRGDK